MLVSSTSFLTPDGRSVMSGLLRFSLKELAREIFGRVTSSWPV